VIQDLNADLTQILKCLHKKPLISYSVGNRSRVPHISLVAREMWDSAALNPKALDSFLNT
jgi:hypothetical protein